MNNRIGKVAPVHAMKAYRSSGGVGPLVLRLVTVCSQVGSITRMPFYVRKRFLGSTE